MDPGTGGLTPGEAQAPPPRPTATPGDDPAARTVDPDGAPRRRRAPGGVLAVALVVAGLAAVLVGVRTAAVCDLDVGCLVVAGDEFTDPDDVAIPVTDGDGYDGQFYYRQARSPFGWSLGEVDGIRMDSEVRAGRIGYPLVLWTASAGGREALVPWAMVAVNVAALGAIGAVLAAGAARSGRSPWWGLPAAAVPGLWFAAGRSLADPLTAALVGAGALALGARRHGWAAAALCAAVLTKEQAVIVPAAYGLWRLWELGRRRARPGAADVPWVAPAVVFLGWQLVALAATGAVPALEAGGTHVVAPLSDLVPALWDWLSPGGASEVLWLVEVAVLVALAALVAVAPPSLGWERLVAVGALVLLVLLNDNVFVDPAHFRQFGELTVVLLVAAFRAPPRWWAPLVAANAAVAAAVAVRLSSSL